MSCVTSPARRTPMTASEQAAVERRYRETRRKVDAATIDVERARYLETLERVGGLVARAKAEGVRPDGRPEVLRKNADVINRARLSEFETRREAWIALGYSPFEAADLALNPPAKLFKRADASGRVWSHADGEYLSRWIIERNATLRRAKSAAAPPRFWRADDAAEHKAVLGPGSRAFGLADDELVEDWTDEFRDEDDDDDWDDDDD
jgi:hypothetical protein